jgi:hypothetical protein
MTRKTRRVAFAMLAGVVVLGAVFWLRPARATERPAGGSHRGGGTLRVRVWEPGGVAPTVSVDVPVVVVSAAIRLASSTGLLDQAIVSACGEHDDGVCPRFRGADLAAIWGQITAGAPVQVVDVDDGAGSRVQVRID